MQPTGASSIHDAAAYQRLVRAHFPGGRLVRAWDLAGGMSARMTALEVEQAGGETQRMVVRRPGPGQLRQDPQAAGHEYRVLQFLHAGGLAVPAPVLFDDSGQVFPAPYLVIEYIPGRPDFSPPDRAAAANQMALQLARIHSLGVPAGSLEGKIAANLGRQLAFLRQSVGGCPELARTTQAPSALPGVERIQAALQASAPPKMPDQPVLLHGDFWPGNILWQCERLAAVVDWEDAHIGDPLSDLAISRLDLAWIYGLDAMQAFTGTYFSLTSIDPSRLPYWDLCAALRLARLVGNDLEGWAAYFHPYGRVDITPAAIRSGFLSFLQTIDF